MFHVEFLIDDRDYARFRHALKAYKTYNYTDSPVTNAKKQNGKIVAEHPTGFLKDRLADAIRERFANHQKMFPRAAIDDIVKELGGTPTSGLIKLLVDQKVIRRKQRGYFNLVPAKG